MVREIREGVAFHAQRTKKKNIKHRRGSPMLYLKDKACIRARYLLWKSNIWREIKTRILGFRDIARKEKKEYLEDLWRCF